MTWKKSNATKRFTLAAALALSLSMLIALSGLAAFIGPARTVEQQVPDPEHDVWTLTHVSAQNQEPDTCLIEQPCGAIPSQEQQQNICGWDADALSCEPAFMLEEVTLPPAMVLGELQCASPGLHGWCLEDAGIALQAQEPLQGETITLIESNLGVLCDPNDGSAVSCSWSAGEQGVQLIQFWAVSSYGDTSELGQVELKLDGIAPQASMHVHPAQSGEDGWFVDGPLILKPQGQDASSGVDTALISLEGGNWADSISLERDGIYQIQVRVQDQAGNETQLSDEVKFDSHAPLIIASLTGKQGLNGWYRSPVEAQASALDTLSGLDEVGITLDGQVRDSQIIVADDGEYALTFWARDIAGNLATEEHGMLRLDQHAPALDHELHGQEGEMGWWVSAVELQALAVDPTSGVAQVRFQIDSGDWQTAGSVRLTDGEHAVTILAQDHAGNQSQQSLMVPVDTHPPVVDIIEQGGELGDGGWYVDGPVQVRAEISDALSGVGEVFYRLDGEGSWFPGNEASFLLDGVHTFEIRALDKAGNEINMVHLVQIDKEPPISALTEPAQTSPVWVTGPVDIRGLTADQTSGVAVVELSLDGGDTYQELAHDADGRWAMDWYTGELGVETIEMMVRSKDRAGNVHEMAPLTMHVDNLRPTIQLDVPCVLNRGCRMEIADPGVGLAHVEILILGGSLGNQTLTFGPNDVPDQLYWDGLLAGEHAEPGEYLVTVRAWDQLGAMSVLVEEGILSEPEVVDPTENPAPTAIPRTPLIPATGEMKPVLGVPEVPAEQVSFDAFVRFMLDQPSTAILGEMILAYFILFLGLAMLIRITRSRV